MPSPDEALAYARTPEEQAVVNIYERLLIVGTPDQVRARIDDVVGRTGADEVMIATHAFDTAARIRSYELLAQTFGLTT